MYITRSEAAFHCMHGKGPQLSVEAAAKYLKRPNAYAKVDETISRNTPRDRSTLFAWEITSLGPRQCRLYEASFYVWGSFRRTWATLLQQTVKHLHKVHAWACFSSNTDLACRVVPIYNQNRWKNFITLCTNLVWSPKPPLGLFRRITIRNIRATRAPSGKGKTTSNH